MADLPRRRRDGVIGVVGAVALGAMTATLVSPPAQADDHGFPSWNDVQKAKADRSAAEAESGRITGLIGDLQDRADAAGRTAAIAAERFHRARLAEDAARDAHTALAAKADAALAVARTSRMRAGLIAASVARGGTSGMQLFFDAGQADDFLQRLTTVSQLSAQTNAILQRAVADGREADALGAQADAAAAVLTERAATAQTALVDAQHASTTAGEAVAVEQRHANRLVAQLADLRGTSVRVAAAYAAGVRAEQEAQPQPLASVAPTVSSRPAAGSGATTVSNTPSDAAPSAVPSATATTAAAPVEPAPVASAPTSAGPPNSAQAASAVAFARDQIGDAYRFGGAGPSSWDCSGLTMQAYASVGISIGGHSATQQYRVAAARGQLVPFAQAQVGDLVFYTDGGGDMYHVAVYSGAGMMIEAPYPGVPVREVPVRAADRVGQVARPTAS